MKKIKHELVWDHTKIKFSGIFAWAFYAYVTMKVILFILSLNL